MLPHELRAIALRLRHEVIAQVDKSLAQTATMLFATRGYLMFLLAFVGSGMVESTPLHSDHRRPHKATVNHKASRHHPRRRFAHPAFMQNEDSFAIPPKALVDLHMQLRAHERSPRSLQSFGKRWTDVEDTIRPATVSTLTKTDPKLTDSVKGGDRSVPSPPEPAMSLDLERDAISTRPDKPQQRPTSIPPGGIASSSEGPAAFPASSSRTDIKALDAAKSDSHVETVTSPALELNASDDHLLVLFLGLIRQIEPKRNISEAEVRDLLAKASRESVNRFLLHLDRHGRHVKRGAPQRKALSLQDILNSFPPTSAPPADHEERRRQKSRHHHHSMSQPNPPALSLGHDNVLVLPPDSKPGGAHRQQLHTIYHNSGLTLRMLPDGRVEFVEELDAYCVVNTLALGLDWTVKIRAEKTGRYLAMRKDGSLYGTMNDSDENTDFQHFYKPRSHDAYKSRRHGSFISIREGRPTRRRFRNDTNKRTHFLVRNTSGGRLLLKELPMPGPTTSVAPKEQTDLPASAESSLVTDTARDRNTTSTATTASESALTMSTSSSLTSPSTSEITTTKVRRKGKRGKKCRKRRKGCKRKKKKKKCRQRKRHRCQSKKTKGRKRKRKRQEKSERRVSRSVESVTENDNTVVTRKSTPTARIDNLRRRVKCHSALLRRMRRRIRNSTAPQAAEKT